MIKKLTQLDAKIKHANHLILQGKSQPLLSCLPSYSETCLSREEAVVLATQFFIEW